MFPAEKTKETPLRFKGVSDACPIDWQTLFNGRLVLKTSQTNEHTVLRDRTAAEYSIKGTPIHRMTPIPTSFHEYLSWQLDGEEVKALPRVNRDEAELLEEFKKKLNVDESVGAQSIGATTNVQRVTVSGSPYEKVERMRAYNAQQADVRTLSYSFQERLFGAKGMRSHGGRSCCMRHLLTLI